MSHFADWIKDTACAFTGDFCPTCEASHKLMKVVVHTDYSPEATSWKVTSKCGSSSDPIMSGGPYEEGDWSNLSDDRTHITVALSPKENMSLLSR